MKVFIQALLKRKVLQALAIYIAVMWVFLQVVDVAQDPLSLPLWISRALILATLIGIPVVALVSWFYDISPSQIVMTSSDDNPEVNTGAVIAFGAIVVVVISISLLISRQRETSIDSQPIEDVISIAVLPFDVDAAEDFSHFQFLADDIIGSLQRSSSVRLVPTDVLDSLDLQQSQDQLIEQLNIHYLISGAIQTANGESNIRVSIFDTEEAEDIWNNNFVGAELASVNQLVANAVLNQFESENLIAPEFTSNARAYDLYLRGQQEFAVNGLSEEGLRFMNVAIEEDPRFALPLTSLCNYYLGLYDLERNPSHFEEAERSCYRSLTLVSIAPEVHFALGMLYVSSGQSSRAIEEFRRVLELNSEHYDAQLQLARALGDQESGYDEAERLLVSLTQRYPGSANAYTALQNLFFTLGRYEEALAPASMAIRLRPQSESAKFSYSGLLLLSGRFREAKEFLIEVLESNPDDRSRIEENLATAYFFDGEFAAAAELYLVSASALPNDDRALANLGDAVWHAEGPETARRVFTQVLALARSNLEINPNDVDHLQSMIIAAGSLNDRELLQTSMDAAIAIAPQNPQNIYRSAVAFMRLGDADYARELASRAIEMGFPQTLVEFDADLKPLF